MLPAPEPRRAGVCDKHLEPAAERKSPARDRYSTRRRRTGRNGQLCFIMKEKIVKGDFLYYVLKRLLKCVNGCPPWGWLEAQQRRVFVHLHGTIFSSTMLAYLFAYKGTVFFFLWFKGLFKSVALRIRYKTCVSLKKAFHS
jgi:hypothetical protein